MIINKAYTEIIHLQEDKAISFAHNFHLAENIIANPEMFRNRRIRTKTFNSHNLLSSKNKFIFIPIGTISAGRYQIQLTLKPHQKAKSSAKYFLVSANQSKISKKIKKLTNITTFNLYDIRKMLMKNKFTHSSSESDDDDCNSLALKKLVSCSHINMNQYKHINYNAFNSIKVILNTNKNHNQTYWGIILELDMPVKQFKFKQGVILNDYGQTSVKGNQKFPNFVDHIPLTYSTSRSFDSFLGIKSIGNSSYSFKISIPKQKNYFHYKLAYISDSNHEYTRSNINIGEVSFNVNLSCNNKQQNITQTFSKSDIKQANNIFHDHKINIPTYCNGETLTLTLDTTFTDNQGILFIVDPVLYNNSSTKRPNLILLTADALRYDHTSLAKYKRNTTPFLQALASNGTSFSKYIIQRGFTQTSFPIIFTGKYPHKFHTINSYELKPTKYITNDLQKILFQNNYNNYSIIGSRNFGKFTMGNLFSNRSLFDSNLNDYEMLAKGYAFIQKHSSDRPYFLWIHLKKPHLPYTPNKEQLKFSNNYPRKSFTRNDKIQLLNNQKEIPAEIIENIIALYDDNILNMDRNIAQFFLKLEKKKLIDNTLIIFSSDHGENMDEHGQFFQHGTLSNACLNVPLVMVMPGKIPAKQNINSLVESTDLLPTILELLKIKKPSGISGKSLVNIINFPNTHHKAYAYSDLDGIFFAIQNNRYKLIINPQEDVIEGINFFAPYTHEKIELYDLKNDPLERNNIYLQELNIGMNLLEKLLPYMIKFKNDNTMNYYTPELLKLLERTGYLHWKTKIKNIKKSRNH